MRDICEQGNIDRVSRVLGLAYADILVILLPVLALPAAHLGRDSSAQPHDYLICFRKDAGMRYALTDEVKLKIKETAHEYMVSMALADWLGVTYPPACDVWRFRAETARENLKQLAATASSLSGGTLRRRLSPF